MAISLAVQRQYGLLAMHSCLAYPVEAESAMPVSTLKFKHASMPSHAMPIGAARSKLQTPLVFHRLCKADSLYAATQRSSPSRRGFRCQGTLAHDPPTHEEAGANATRGSSWTREDNRIWAVGESSQLDRALEPPLFSVEDNAISLPDALSSAEGASSTRNGHSSKVVRGMHGSAAAAYTPPATDASSQVASLAGNVEAGPLPELHADTFSTMEALISERDVLGGDHETFIMEAIARDYVHFLAPQGKRRHLPLFVFLPGLDGTGLFCKRQLPGLLESYDVRCLVIPTGDTSSFAELAEAAAGLIRHERVARQKLAVDDHGEHAEGSQSRMPVEESEPSSSEDFHYASSNLSVDANLKPPETSSVESPPFPVTVYGESFGTGIALHLASTYPEEVHSLVVLNCVTAFRRQPLLQLGSRFLGAVPAGMHDMGSYAMAPLLADWRRMAEDSRFLLVPPLSTRVLTPEAVTHRTQMMVEVDPSEVELGRIKASTLLIASAQDRLMPSVEEADWLASRIPNCRIKVLPESGHVALLEEGICLATLLREAGVLDGPGVGGAAVGGTDRGREGADLLEGWRTGEALPIEKDTAKEWGYAPGDEEASSSESGPYVGQLGRGEKRSERESGARVQPRASAVESGEPTRGSDQRRDNERERYGDSDSPEERPEDFAEAYNENRGGRRLRDDLAVELKTMTQRLKEGMDDDRPKEGSSDDQAARRRIADSLRRKGDLSDGLKSRGIEPDGSGGEEGLEDRWREQRLADGFDSPGAVSDGVGIAPAQEDEVAQRLAENRRKFFEGGSPSASSQQPEVRRTIPDSTLSTDPAPLPAAPKGRPAPIVEPTRPTASAAPSSSTNPTVSMSSEKKRTVPKERAVPIVEPTPPAVSAAPVDSTVSMPSKKKRTVPIEEVNRRRRSRRADGSLGASNSILGGDMRWLQGLGGGLFSGFTGSSKGFASNQTGSFRNEVAEEDGALRDLVVPELEANRRDGALPRGKGTAGFLDQLSGASSASTQAELTGGPASTAPGSGPDVMSRVSLGPSVNQDSSQVNASIAGRDRAERLNTGVEEGMEQVKDRTTLERATAQNGVTGVRSSAANRARELNLPGTWVDVTDTSNGNRGDGSIEPELSKSGHVSENGNGGAADLEGLRNRATTSVGDKNVSANGERANGRTRRAVKEPFEVKKKETGADDSGQGTDGGAKSADGAATVMAAGQAVTVVWQGQGKGGLLAIGSAAAQSKPVKNTPVKTRQPEASTSESTKTKVKDMDGEAERGGWTSGAGAGQPDPPRKKAPEDLKLAGATAGRAFDVMLEDMPQYRLWNWLTRPEFYGMDNIPVDAAPLLFVGNHTLFGIYDMPLMLYELRKRRGLVLRGLAHEWHWKSPLGEIFEKYGAVKATPRNCFNLLKAGEPVLLYPGGGREVAKRKGEKYKLLWKDDTDFVRLAMKCRATIVPFATVGVEDAFDILMGPDEIMATFGDLIRPALKATGFTDDVIPSLATGGNLLPRPERLYFHFGEPIYTSQYTRADLKDKEKCARLYKQAKTAVEDGIVLLQEKRTKDPLRELFPRVMMNVMEGWDGT